MKKGMTLITILIFVLLLFALIGVLLYFVTNARILNVRYDENLIALNLAEAGVDYAIWEINFSDGDFLATEGWSGADPKEKTIANFKDLDSNIYGNIEIKVYGYGTGTVTILSEGILSSTITGPDIGRLIRVEMERHKLFSYAILTSDAIDLGGTKNKIDSYDSSKGVYGETYEEDGETKTNIGQEGNIVTNGQADPAITLRGAATVEGDAVTGPGGTVSFEGGSTVSGNTSDNADIFMPPVEVPGDFGASVGPLFINKKGDPPFTAGYHTYDSLTLTGKGELILDAAGGDVNIYLTQNPSINTDGQSQIIVRNGNANIYFDGDVNIAAQGVLNENGDPSNLTFYGTDTVSNINLAGIGTFYGTFYAPEANYFWISGNSEIYGAVVGKNVSLTGSATIHYDENLMDDGPTSGYDPHAWHEK
jgi:hypothetical protein